MFKMFKKLKSIKILCVLCSFCTCFIFTFIFSCIFTFIPLQAEELFNETNSSLANDPVFETFRFYKEAGISSEQEVKINQILQEHEKSARVRLERMRILFSNLRDLSFEPELDETKITDLQNEINKLQADINNDRLSLMIKIRSLLNSEQRIKLIEIMRSKNSERKN